MIQRWFPALLVAATAILALSQMRHVFAIDPVSGSAEEREPTPIEFRVLDQKTILQGGRSITLKKVEAPALPDASVAQNAQQAETSVTVDSEATNTASKPQRYLAISATVFDRQLTELRWSTGGANPGYHAWSNIDFNLVASIGRLETENAIYSVFIALGNETSPEKTARTSPEKNGVQTTATTKPSTEQFLPGISSYLLYPRQATGETTAEADDDALAAMDTLHAYYDQNRDALQQTFVQREAEREASAQWLKEHPPQPKDIVIHYWRKDGAASSSTTSKEGANAR